jgi:hypothetical protein
VWFKLYRRQSAELVGAGPKNANALRVPSSPPNLAAQRFWFFTRVCGRPLRQALAAQLAPVRQQLVQLAPGEVVLEVSFVIRFASLQQPQRFLRPVPGSTPGVLPGPYWCCR